MEKLRLAPAVAVATMLEGAVLTDGEWFTKWAGRGFVYYKTELDYHTLSRFEGLYLEVDDDDSCRHRNV